MSAEAPKINIPAPKVEVETIAEKRIRPPKGQKRFERIESGVEGVELIVEHGAEVHYPRRTVRRFQADSDRIARYRGRHEPVFKGAKGRLVKVAESEDQPGFRGVASARGNYESPLVPTEKTVYDPNLLEESTGDYYKTLVREEGRAAFYLPFGSYEDAREGLARFAQAAARVMVEEFGIDPEQVGALIQTTIVQRLDEERMNQLIAEGRITLELGTRKTTFEWGTPINAIDKMTTPRRQRPLISETS